MSDTMNALILSGDGYATGRPASAVLTDASSFVSLGDLPIPTPSEGQVRIAVTLAAVNPSDEMFIQGLYGQPRIAGNAAGFEGVGVVDTSGGGQLADAMVGQRVAFVASPSGPGTWSQYSVADASTCIPLIDGVRDEDGAAMIVNPLTALAMFEIVKEHESRAFIVSAGASQLCKLMISSAHDEGYRPIALVRRVDQIDDLKALGAAHVLNITADDFDGQLRAVIGEEKPRVFLDAVANEVSSLVFSLMPRRARWVVYGKLGEVLPTILEPGQLIFMMKQIEGFWLTRWMTEKPIAEKMTAIQTAQSRFASGEWKTDVTAVIPLGDAVDRLASELAKPNGKVFLKP